MGCFNGHLRLILRSSERGWHNEALNIFIFKTAPVECVYGLSLLGLHLTITGPRLRCKPSKAYKVFTKKNAKVKDNSSGLWCAVCHTNKELLKDYYLFNDLFSLVGAITCTTPPVLYGWSGHVRAGPGRGSAATSGIQESGDHWGGSRRV